MISKIAVLEPRIFSGRSNQKENKIIASKLDYSATTTFDTPDSFYNKQLLSLQKKSSGVNFSGFHLREVSNFHCPCCGKMMYTQEQIKKFAEKLSTAKGENISKILDPYTKQLHPIENKVAYILISLSKKHPEKNIKELLMLKRYESKNVLEREQAMLVNSVMGDAIQLSGDVSKEMVSRLNNINQIIYSGKDGKPFKRKKVLATINKFALAEQNLSNQEILKRMSDTIQALPVSGQDFNAFVLKYTQKDRGNLEIASRLLLPNQPTIEHIDPALRSVKNLEHGKNDISNYLDMCLDCNGDRGTEPYYSFVERKPQMKENLQKHMDEVQHYIRKRDLPSYYNYPLNIRKAIREQSTPPGGKSPRLDFNTSLIENFIERKTELLKELSQQYQDNK